MTHTAIKLQFTNNKNSDAHTQPNGRCALSTWTQNGLTTSEEKCVYIYQQETRTTKHRKKVHIFNRMLYLQRVKMDKTAVYQKPKTIYKHKSENQATNKMFIFICVVKKTEESDRKKGSKLTHTQTPKHTCTNTQINACTMK